MTTQPPYLKEGDKVAIVCPAKKLPRSIDQAVKVLEAWGLEVVIGETVNASHHQFAGDDELRAADLQGFLDDPEVKAIIAGRGGYGTIRIIDALDFTKFKANPKWIAGFSDITVLLSHLLAKLNTQSIHGQMLYTFDDATPESLSSLKNALFGEPDRYEYEPSFPGRSGSGNGILVGGNLTLMVMLQGSISEVNYDDNILFIEDVGEHEYAIDRMMRMLKRAGKLSKLKGLIVGAFNGQSTESIPFGASAEQIIMDIVKEYDYPVCFNFPVGHINDNRAMIVGRPARLVVSQPVNSILDPVVTFYSL